MKEKLLYYWDLLRGNYWTIPALFCIVAVISAIVFPLIDRQIIIKAILLPEVLYIPTTTLRTVLPAVGTSMLSITGTVFSVIIVVLSLTSAQFGPRLLRVFMNDIVTQFTLGSFLSTGLYALLLLPNLEVSDGNSDLAISTVFVAISLLISIGMFIFYVHHIAVSIQAPNVVNEVSNELHAAIDRLTLEKTPEIKEILEVKREWNENYKQISLNVDGYVLSIDSESAIKLAKESNIIIQFLIRPGDFIYYSSSIAKIWGEFDQQEITKRIKNLLILGNRRSPRYDLECSIDELVELAVRALSPGINDPFTAISVIDRLGSELSYVTNREFPNIHLFDNDDTLRVILKELSFNSILEAAFNQIRQAGRADVSVVSRLLESLLNLTESTNSKIHLESISKQTNAVVESAKSNFLEEGIDFRAIKIRFDTIEKLLKNKLED